MEKATLAATATPTTCLGSDWFDPLEQAVSGGAKIPHVYRPDTPAAAAQKCVTELSLSARVRAEGEGMKGVDLYARMRGFGKQFMWRG